MLSVDGFGRAVCETLSIDVFRNESLDVPSISWHILLSGLVIGSSDPVFGESTAISKDDFIILQFLSRLSSIKTVFGIVGNIHSVQQVSMLSSILKDFSLNLSSGGSESKTFGWDMSCVPWHKVLLEVRCSCSLSHSFYLLN